MINWRGAFRGAALAVGDQAAQAQQVLISDRVAQKREARMAQYQSQASEQQLAGQIQLQDRQFAAQGAISQREMEAKQRQAEIDRMQELADGELEQQRKKELVRYEGEVNPQAPKTQSAYQKKFEEGEAGNHLELLKSAEKSVIAAYELEDSLSIMEDLNEAFKTGRLEEFKADLGRWLDTDASKALETYRGVMAPIVLAKLNEATGPQTDQDAIRIEQATANFGTSNEANAVLIDLMRQSITRANERYRDMIDYAEKNNGLKGYRIPTDVRLLGDANNPVEANPSDGAAENAVNVVKDFESWKANR